MVRGCLAHVAVCAAIILAWPTVARADSPPLPRTPANIHELLSAPLTRHADISPSGRFAVTIVYARKHSGIRVRDLETGREAEILYPLHYKDRDHQVESVLWEDDDTLFFAFARMLGDRTLKFREFVDLEPTSDGLNLRRTEIRQEGTVVDATPGRSGEVIYSPDHDPNAVYRVSTRRLTTMVGDWRVVDADEADAPVRLARLKEQTFTWLVDHEGAVRAATSFSSKPLELHYWYRSDSKADWRLIRREKNVDKFDDLVALGFTQDGKRLLVASALDRDRYGLYEYDPERNQVGALVYEHPTAELVSLLFDAEGRDLVAVVYVEDGERRFAYLSETDRELAAATRAHFPKHTVSITGASANRRRFTLLVSRSDDPGGFFAFDLDTNEVTPIGRVAPWLDDDQLAEMEIFAVQNKEGQEIDAFITKPTVPTAKPPLVIMPHGGPIGVADARAYSGYVQYLARSGFAVLQVNYRGSGGYGRRFEQAGHRQWGRGIEDDIDSAIDFVVEQGWVDASRMCVVGGSYGGYSALMSVVRHPKRFRCAASLNGVTDIALLFNVDEVTGGEFLTKSMEKIVGDPEKSYDEMRRFSPVYQAHRIEVPIHLAHGEWDRTVDLDHMIRMKLALDAAGVPTEARILAKTGHGFASRHDAVRYWLSLYEFLAEHLKR